MAEDEAVTRRGSSPLGSATADTCPECDSKTWRYKGRQPGYDHIHPVRSLPHEDRETETHLVLHGYAAGIADETEQGLPQTWIFFEHLEPALVFGRAGRMSVHDISSYGVYRAAREVRFDSDTGQQITTLYVTGCALDREPGEAKHFARWTSGVRSGSAYYAPLAPHAATDLERVVSAWWDGSRAGSGATAVRTSGLCWG